MLEDLHIFIKRFFNNQAKELTALAYEQDLRSFVDFLNDTKQFDAKHFDLNKLSLYREDPDLFIAASFTLFTKPERKAVALVEDFGVWLRKSDYASATINRRLAMLKSYAFSARKFGLIDWDLELVSLPEVEKYRDTEGPGIENMQKILSFLEEKKDCAPDIIRNTAILRLIYDHALRRGGVASLDASHVNLEKGTIEILAKGKFNRKEIKLTAESKEALSKWLEIRNGRIGPGGPLFVPLSGKGAWLSRLTTTSIYRIIVEMGKSAGAGHVKPHGIRHTAITEALEASGGNITKVQDFSGHAEVKTVGIYNDNRNKGADQISKLLSDKRAEKIDRDIENYQDDLGKLILRGEEEINEKLKDKIVDAKLLRRLVDVVWGEANEDESVPATDWADRMIMTALNKEPSDDD